MKRSVLSLFLVFILSLVGCSDDSSDGAGNATNDTGASADDSGKDSDDNKSLCDEYCAELQKAQQAIASCYGQNKTNCGTEVSDGKELAVEIGEKIKSTDDVEAAFLDLVNVVDDYESLGCINDDATTKECRSDLDDIIIRFSNLRKALENAQ